MNTDHSRAARSAGRNERRIQPQGYAVATL
jgi:hypothetical protein